VRLSAANTAIVLDSTADLPGAADRFPNWRVVPLYVRFGDESLRDGVDIDATEFYARLTVGDVFPATSQPTPGDFLDCYRELAAYERILSLHVSARVSGTFASAETAAAELGDGRVRAIDTETASAAIAMLALAIQRRLDRGTSDEEIDALVDRYRRVQSLEAFPAEQATPGRKDVGLLFTVDTLEFLARGGRIGKAAAFAGTLLHVKPILSIRDGEVVPVKRVRGERKAFAELAAALETQTRDEPEFKLAVAHAAAPERAAELEALVRERRPRAELELVVTLGAVIGAHAGPGTLALFWFRDE